MKIIGDSSIRVLKWEIMDSKVEFALDIPYDYESMKKKRNEKRGRS